MSKLRHLVATMLLLGLALGWGASTAMGYQYAYGFFSGGSCSGAASTLANQDLNIMTTLDGIPPNHPLKIQLQTTGGTCAGVADPAGSYISGQNYVKWGRSGTLYYRRDFCWVPSPYSGNAACSTT